MIKEIHNLLAEDTTEILQTSQKEGCNLVIRLIRDHQSGLNCFNQSGEVLLGCDISHLVAVGGLNIEKTQNFENYGRIRRVYVLPEYRKRGIGRELVTKILDYGSSYFIGITCNVGKLDSFGFYESLGFTRENETSNITHIYRFNT